MESIGIVQTLGGVKMEYVRPEVSTLDSAYGGVGGAAGAAVVVVVVAWAFAWVAAEAAV